MMYAVWYRNDQKNMYCLWGYVICETDQERADFLRHKQAALGSDVVMSPARRRKRIKWQAQASY